VNCKTCRRAIHQLDDGTWGHDNLTDVLLCPGGTVEPAMFDMLTLGGLYKLHSSLCASIIRLSDRMIPAEAAAPRLSVFGDEWAALAGASRELNETAAAVYAEITCREAERVDA
jgi:hypothetical protein